MKKIAVLSPTHHSGSSTTAPRPQSLSHHILLLYNPLLRLPNYLVDRLGKVVDVLGIQARHADPPVLRHVHMRLVSQGQHLLLAQAREGKHADLIGDVVPRAWGAQGLELCPQLLAHGDDPPGHRPQVLLPLLEQGLVVQHQACDASAVCRGIRDFGTLQNRELRSDSANGVLGVRTGAGNEVEATGPLTVETEVLGEGLRNAQLEALLDEVVDGPGVLGQIARGEALVRAIEEREMRLLLQQNGQLLPLVLCRVDAGGVVCAGMHQDDAAVWGVGDGLLHAGEVEALRLGGEVRVGCDGEGDIGEDLVVVGPRRVADVGRRGTGEEAFEKESSEMDGSCT